MLTVRLTSITTLCLTGWVPFCFGHSAIFWICVQFFERVLCSEKCVSHHLNTLCRCYWIPTFVHLLAHPLDRTSIRQHELLPESSRLQGTPHHHSVAYRLLLLCSWPSSAVCLLMAHLTLTNTCTALCLSPPVCDDRCRQPWLTLTYLAMVSFANFTAQAVDGPRNHVKPHAKRCVLARKDTKDGPLEVILPCPHRPPTPSPIDAAALERMLWTMGFKVLDSSPIASSCVFRSSTLFNYKVMDANKLSFVGTSIIRSHVVIFNSNIFVLYQFVSLLTMSA